jgi:hypothetical protein
MMLIKIICNDNNEQSHVFNLRKEPNQKSQATEAEVIVDSDLNFTSAVKGSSAPNNIISQLILINVEYYSFDNKIHRGQLLIDKTCEKSVINIFIELQKIKFPIEKIIPIVVYDWNDSISMTSNNSSGFNFRYVYATKTISKHSFGKAIDLNPKLNPYIVKGKYQPVGSSYDTTKAGTFSSTSLAVNIFKKNGWKWGGDWIGVKDYQHFYR